MAEIHAGLRFTSLRSNFDSTNLRFMGPGETRFFLRSRLNECWKVHNRARDALI
jgi:hypothetical protein